MIGELTPLQQERRKNILDAATNHFSEVGFHKGEMEVIAREAGVGKGTIYRYFKNKHDLYLNTIEYQLEMVFEYVDQNTEKISDPIEFLKGLINSFIQYFEKNSRTFDIILLSSMDLVDDVIEVVAKIRDKYYKKFKIKIQLGIDTGIFQNLNKYIVLRALDASTIYLMYEQLKKTTFTIEEIEDNLNNLFLNGLIAKPKR